MNEERRELEISLLLMEIESKDLKTEDEWNEWLKTKAMDWEREIGLSSVAALAGVESLI